MSTPTTASTALIVDDDDDVRALMSTVVGRAGYGYEAVDGGRPALQSAQRHRPTIYILDARMPDLHGHDVCRRLKADPRTTAPVLMVSAEASEADIAAAYAAGCDDFLPKPFRPRELIARISRLIDDTDADAAA